MFVPSVLVELAAALSLEASSPTPAPQNLPALDTGRVSIGRAGISMAEALADLSQQTALCILADDVPRRESANVEVKGTARQALDRISTLFDYTWKEGAHGAILLTKRFSNPAEAPQIHLADAAHVADSVLRTMGYPGRTISVDGMDACLMRLYASLDPLQVRLAESGGLPVGHLAVQQRQLVYEAALDAGFGGLFAAWSRLASQLRGLDGSWLALARPTVFSGRFDRTAAENAVFGWQDMDLTYYWSAGGAVRKQPLAQKSVALTPPAPGR